MKNIMPKTIWATFGLIAIFGAYLVIVLSFWLYSQNRIYPGVSVAGISLSGKTKKEAESILKEKIDAWGKESITLSAEKPSTIAPSEINIQFDTEKTVKDALSVGSRNPFFLGKKKEISLLVSFNTSELTVKIDEAGSGIVTPVTNSRVEKTGGDTRVRNGIPGKRINYSETAANLKEVISKLDHKADISVFEVPPTFIDRDLAGKISEINEKSKDGLVLLDGKKKYNASSDTIVSWVELIQPKRVLARNMEGDEFYAPLFNSKSETSIFSSALVSGYLLDLSGKINQDPVNAALTISGEKAVILTSSKNGKTLNIESSTQGIISSLDSKEKEVSLMVDTVKPEIREETLGDMGISELLSTGSTNFAGSPTNRKHNIRTGASKFNGVLVKPNESFSFNETLGPVDASTGYLPELVIKENKTIPEYGGGMCQVSSTAFRAALNGTLPILERTAHSYPVSYYKPYGVDATVYLPHPDLVFKNDTGKYILIQTRISGNNLYFDFYGTKPQKTVKFGGSENGEGAVFPVEKVTPNISDQGARGNNSFTAVFYRFIYDAAGKLIKTNKFVSKYDSPDKYPH